MRQRPCPSAPDLPAPGRTGTGNRNHPSVVAIVVGIVQQVLGFIKKVGGFIIVSAVLISIFGDRWLSSRKAQAA